MVEKLLTLTEAAERLGLSEEEVRRLVEKGEIPAYQIGGMYLRFKEEQILSLRPRYMRNGEAPEAVNNAERPQRLNDTFLSRLNDFFYFNDFYIFSSVVIFFLLYLIANSIK